MNFPSITSLIQAVTALLGLLANSANIPLELRNRAIMVANQAMEVANQELRNIPTSTPAGSGASSPGAALPAVSEPAPPASSRAVTYNITSNDPGPAITKIIFDPNPLTLLAERETFQIWIQDSDGVAEASAVFDVNTASQTIPLRLSQGTTKNGVWSGEWQSPAPTSTFSVYRTKFYAKDILGNLSKVEMNWTNN